MGKWSLNYETGDYEDIEKDGFSNTTGEYTYNCFIYDDYAVCGTRGWIFEENAAISEHDNKILKREVLRLKASLESAGDIRKIVFLHYPPVFFGSRCEEIIGLLQDYNVRQCFYGHVHGKACEYAFNGWLNGTEYRLVSADYINFEPVRINLY